MHRSLLTSLFVCATFSHAAPITLTSFDLPWTENFNTLAASSTSSVVPAGWAFLEAGSTANGTYGANAGASATGNTYSYGLGTATDRAFGTLRTGSLASVLGVNFQNATSAIIADLLIGFTGEQWRLGATGRSDRLDFAYSLDATSLGNGTWTEVDALDIVSPVTSGALGARDGNQAANRVGLSHTLTGLDLAPGSGFWLRWVDFEALNSDDGLAVDDFSIQAIRKPTVPTTPVSAVPDDLPSSVIGGVIGLMGLYASRTRRGALKLRA
jgi:hypothetical protein